MKDFQLIAEGNEINFKFPTSIDEITKDYLLQVTSQVHVANDYTLLAIVYHEKIGSVIITRKQAKKSITGAVVPIVIKSGACDNDFIKSMQTKDKVIIDSAMLSTAYHVTCPKNTLSLDYFIRRLDKDISVAARYGNAYGNEECYFVEFKIVPNSAIIGYYNETDKTEVTNPYINIKKIED